MTKISPLGVERGDIHHVEVRVSIDNPGGELKALMTANAEIIVTEHHDALSVSEQAMSWDNDKNAFVFVPDPKSKKYGQKRVPRWSPAFPTAAAPKSSPGSRRGSGGTTAIASRAKTIAPSSGGSMMLRRSTMLASVSVALAVAARPADGTFDKTLHVNGQVMLNAGPRVRRGTSTFRR